MTRARGMTLVEVMVATALAGILSGSLLMMVRSQLIAYETSDQVNRAQQNARVAIDLLESMGRRACGGLASGQIGVPNMASPQPCLRVWDGAVQSGGTFTTGTATSAADAIEIIFASSPFSKLVGAPSLSASPPTASVADVSGFAAGDLVIIGDMQTGVLLKIATGGVSATGSGGPPTAGTLTFAASVPNAEVPPTLNLGSTTSLYVMKAYSYALYVQPASPPGPYANMLMLDPDGMIGTSHGDAQPLADGVIDLQAAVGIDGNADGIITENAGGAGDEWFGNAAGETVAAPPWNGTGQAQLRQLRITTVTQTLNSYPGVAPTIGPFEDRTTYPSTATGGGPRYRSERVVIAPRIWNLLN